MVAEKKKRRELPKRSREEPAGPADEYEALRVDFLSALRRQPADRRSLLRHAESLARMQAALRRMSPRQKDDLSENLAEVLARFGDIIMPADR